MAEDHLISLVEWRERLALLEREDWRDGDVVAQIVRLAKPYDLERIREGAPVIAKYLHHSDPFIRHEALWFLCGWGNSFGKFQDYGWAALDMFKSDPDNNNRAYAARCLAGYQTSPTLKTINLLIAAAGNESEEAEVRLSIYGTLVAILKGRSFRKEADRFHYASLWGATPADFDWDWLLVDQENFLRTRP